jgi:hypothetical protein
MGNSPVASTTAGVPGIIVPGPRPKQAIETVANSLLYSRDTDTNGVVDAGDAGTEKFRNFLKANGAKMVEVTIKTPRGVETVRGYDAAGIADAIRSAKIAGGDGMINGKEYDKLFTKITTPFIPPKIDFKASRVVGSIVDGTSGDGPIGGPGLDVNNDHVLDRHDIENSPYAGVDPDGNPTPEKYNPVARLLKAMGGGERVTTVQAKQFLAKYAGADGRFNQSELGRMERVLWGSPMATDAFPGGAIGATGG